MASAQTDSLPDHTSVLLMRDSPPDFLCASSAGRSNNHLDLRSPHPSFCARAQKKANVLRVGGVRRSRKTRPGESFSFVDCESLETVRSESPRIPPRLDMRRVAVVYSAPSAPDSSARFRSASIIFICGFSHNVPASVRCVSYTIFRLQPIAKCGAPGRTRPFLFYGCYC